MPIKFRCEYCRQLMGIAEIKAGSLVDCPTCGRTLRVPNRDGTVDPPPKPQVNPADNGLRRALDELAHLGYPSATGDTPNTPSAVPGSVQAAAIPDLASASDFAPREIPPNSLVNSIALEPLPPQKVVELPVARRESIGGPSLPSTASPEQILAAIPGRSMPFYTTTVAPGSKSRGRVGSLTGMILACSICLLAGAVGGFVVGRSMVAVPSPRIAPKKELPAAQTAPVTTIQSQVQGHVTYRNVKEQTHADAGACIIILPVKRPESSKLPIIGFRPNDDDATRQAAVKLLEEQGGRLGLADADGHYQIDAPDPGDYYIVALSHFQGRAKDDEGSQASHKILTERFDRPAQLIGKLAFRVSQIKRTGTTPVTWNCAFDESAVDQ